jgi:hypothetical protein
MTTGATGQLGLALPVQGELSGTWGDTVNNGITQYTNIAIAGTLTLTGDGAVTLANTTGDASASNITSSLTGAGTVTAQFAIVKIAGTLTTTKIVTFGSVSLAPYSKTFMVVNAATGGTVTFKAYGQTGVSIAVGESALLYYNGTDMVKATTTVSSGVSSFTAGTTGFTPSTATTGVVTLAGTLAVANGGTGLTAGTSGGVLAYTATGTLASSAALTANALVLGGGAGAAPAPLGSLGTTSTVLHGNAAGAPTFGAVALGTDVSGTLPVANGGTGLTAGTSGGILAYTATGTLASSAALTANKVVIGGGAGVVPSTTTVLGTAAAVTTGTYIQAVGYADTVVALGNTGTAINLDVTGGNVFSATLNGNATITLRYPVATGSSSFTLILTNDATAGRTVAWAGGTFLYPGGAASLSRTTTANATDIWFFFTPNGGTTWYGTIPMKNLIA